MKISYLFVVCTVVCAVTPHMQKALNVENNDDGITQKSKMQFDNWRMENNKVYDNDFTLSHRMQIFMRNQQTIRLHNMEHPNHTWGLTVFADMTVEEFREKMLITFDKTQKRHVTSENSQQNHLRIQQFPILSDLGESQNLKDKPIVDWRHRVIQQYYFKKNEVQSQGEKCNSCWAFAAADVFISRLAVFSNIVPSQLSKSMLVDCIVESKHCQTGETSNVFNYLNKYGGLMEDQYRPYDGTYSACVKGFGKVGKDKFEEEQVEKASQDPAQMDRDIIEGLKTGPVAVCVESGDNWMLYTGEGSIDTCSYARNPANVNANHYISIVGYTATQYILKNSWGTEWGDKGYFYMDRVSGNTRCLDKIIYLNYPLIKM